MISALFFAAFIALPGVPPARAWEAAQDVTFVVLTDGPLPLSDDADEAREATGRLLLEWAARESALRADAVGDGGRSFGVLQVSRQWLDGHAPAEVLASRRLGLSLGLAVMRVAIAKCGSVRGGLGLYASGKCSGAPSLVARRCVAAGLTEMCRSKGS